MVGFKKVSVQKSSEIALKFFGPPHPLFDVPEEPLQADPAGPGASWCYDLDTQGGVGQR